MKPLERIATKAPAFVFYGIAGLFGLLGMIFLWLPLIGVPLMAVGYVSYLVAGIAKRKAREREVRRQL